MQDELGRSIRYLRLSVTSACPMRCTYCRPAVFGAPDRQALLTPLEMDQLVRHLVRRHGLRKLRVTGGEPTARPELTEIIQRLSMLPLDDLAMTTNGLTLVRDAPRLKEAGLRRVNVSLDSLDPARFAQLTGVDALPRVLAGIATARAAGLEPIKLNTVVVRGQNDREIPELLLFAAKLGLDIRFIELMPMGPLASQWRERYVTELEMRHTLGGVVVHWAPLPMGSESARRFRVYLAGGKEATIGFITAMSHPFCDACDRIRISADGGFYPCLMDAPAANLMPAIRPDFDPDRLDDLLRQGLRHKALVHPANGFSPMIQLGG
jgi:GTP 3',8-cyclase